MGEPAGDGRRCRGVMFARPVALLWVAASIVAQDPVEELRGASRGEQFATIAQKLQSKDRAEVAWGGFLAAELEVREAADELRAALRELAVREYADRKLASVAVLDALVRIDGEVPGDELEPFLRGLERDAAFVLIAREPEENAVLLMAQFERHAGKSGRRVVFLASGHLLAAIGAPQGFAADLLGLLRVELDIYLHDTDDWGGVGIGGGAGGSRGDGAVDVPEGHPPVALYELATGGGGFLVAEGHEPVYATRSVREGRRFGIGSSNRRFDRDEHARSWLAQLLEVEALALPRRKALTVDTRTQDPDALRARARAELEAAFEQLVGALRERELVSTEQADAARLEIEEAIHDHREK